MVCLAIKRVEYLVDLLQAAGFIGFYQERERNQ